MFFMTPMSLGLTRYSRAGGIPSWVTPGPDGTLPTDLADYAGNRGWYDGHSYGSINAYLAGASGTFSRGSDATYFDASGILRTAGPNVLRLDHDPVTGKELGARLEGGRTNLLLGSGAPATQNIAVTAQAYTLSFFGLGQITLSGAHSAVLSGVAAPGRAVLTFTPSAGTLTVAVSGDVRFCQLEAGTFASSYIPTTSASAQRLADSLTFARAAPPEGTVAIEGQVSPATPSYAWSWGQDGTNRLTLQRVSSGALQLIVVTGSSVRGFVTTPVQVPGSDFKAAFSWTEAGVALSLNGAAALTSALTGDLPPMPLLSVGCNHIGANNWFNTLARLGIFDRAYSPEQLQEMSA